MISGARKTISPAGLATQTYPSCMRILEAFPNNAVIVFGLQVTLIPDRLRPIQGRLPCANGVFKPI